LTPGRVSEALATAGTASLSNVILHVDWNQASIDSNRVCRDDGQPGDYVQWNPMELAYLHDWNVILVPKGHDFQQVIAAQRAARTLDTTQPTAIVYRTTKGWRYGVEGKASHGAGHKLCTDGFYEAVTPLLEKTNLTLPRCDAEAMRCEGGKDEDIVEECFWQALGVVRKALEYDRPMVGMLATRLAQARERLQVAHRSPRPKAPRVDLVFKTAQHATQERPPELALEPGS